MATSESSIESLSTVMIDMGTESVRDSASHSTTIAQLRTSLLSRKKIPNNIVFFDSNGYIFTDEAEQSTNMKQLANEQNIVTLKTNRSNRSPVQIPEPKHKRNDRNSEVTYIQTLNQTTRTPLSEIKITDSPSESSFSNSNSIKYASELDWAMWREIFRKSNLCYGIRMDKNTPECALYPAFEFQHSTNSTFQPKVEDSFIRKDYIKDKEMQISFVSSDFFDGELAITCPYVGIGVNGGYFKSKAQTSTERLVYKIRCDKYPRVILTLDSSYMKPTTSFIRKIDEILSLSTINQQIIELKNFYKQYGHVYATKVVLGGNCYRKETHIVNDIAEENKLRVNAGVSCKLPVFPSPSVQVGSEHQKNSQTKTSDQTSDLLWETVGGDVLKFNSQNMTPWKDTLYDPLLWRVIEQDDYQPIITILDEQRKRKIEEIENYYKAKNQETDSSEEEEEEIDIK
ncbi:hypothetical protein I4U23_022089 [Adineta vaga]|nr:hypothetical protein I4U23_022089 [Adineta vaga]